MKRHFFTLDVFTGKPLAGNPLAVVLESQGLNDGRMQAIAREFNLSETVFVAFPANLANRCSVRTFTTGREVPCARHPTVGTAVLFGLLDRDGKPGAASIALEEKIGLEPCAVDIAGPERGAATFTLPQLPQRIGSLPDRAVLARGLGLEEADIGFASHNPRSIPPAIRHSPGLGACRPVRSSPAVSGIMKPIGTAASVIKPTTMNAALKSDVCGVWWWENVRAASSANAPAVTPMVAANCWPAVYRLVAALICGRGTSPYARVL